MKFRFGIFALLLKIGPKIFTLFIKLLKGAKLGKVGLAGASMVTYSFMFTWQFALMIMVMLFIHESGHIWAMKRWGIKTKGIYFIPFFGGAAVSDKEFPSRWAESHIALMGPVWGLAVSLATALIYVATKDPLWAAGVGWMAMCNLFNLLPINPLDGGRVLKSIAFSFHSVFGFAFLLFGLLACLILAIYAGFGLFLILFPIGILELCAEFFGKRMRGERDWRKYIHANILRHKDIVSFYDESLKIALAQPEPKTLLDMIDNDERIRILKVKKGGAEAQLFECQAILASYTDRTEKPIMNLRQIGLSVAGYLGIGTILWILMNMIHHVPDVETAMNFLKG
ncbi:MAG: Peptidase M50 [Parcubacteria group bacterium GW2011_GWA2_38_13]|nr:MAG: Peptidase M50 [Parcubacteria group bacterium GW2011_GWA2_38_13]